MWLVCLEMLHSAHSNRSDAQFNCSSVRPMISSWIDAPTSQKPGSKDRPVNGCDGSPVNRHHLSWLCVDGVSDGACRLSNRIGFDEDSCSLIGHSALAGETMHLRPYGYVMSSAACVGRRQLLCSKRDSLGPFRCLIPDPFDLS